MKNKLLLLCVITIINLVSLAAQDCGTKIPEGFFQNSAERLKKGITESSIPYTTIPDVNLSISVFVTNTGITKEVLAPAIDSLNIAFEPIGISFTLCDLTLIENLGFIDVNDKNEEILTTRYNAPNTINLYVVRGLNVPPLGIVCGMAYLPTLPALDYVFLSNLCNFPNTLIHEMGHFFGLLHPHATEGGFELVNGSNCTTAGDLVCDTEASPDLSGNVSKDCEYTGSSPDANGDYYVPTVSNYMAYSPQDCRCKFTSGQYRRMLEFYWSHKSHLR